jgi:hypothetical protein
MNIENKAVSITEKDIEIIASWFTEARDGNTSVDEFIKKLNDNYEHDYGTICKAVAAAAVKAAWAMNAQPQGGITGFQSGAVMWEFIQHWMSLEGQPLKLIHYNHMLYPQYDYKFDKVIDKSTWEWLQKKAKEYQLSAIESEAPNSSVAQHWQSIIDGVVPFGYSVKKEEED